MGVLGIHLHDGIRATESLRRRMGAHLLCSGIRPSAVVGSYSQQRCGFLKLSKEDLRGLLLDLFLIPVVLI